LSSIPAFPIKGCGLGPRFSLKIVFKNMRSIVFLVFSSLLLGSIALAQQPSNDKASDRDREAGESSSRDTRGDITPPKNDAKEHPDSKAAVADFEDETPPDSSIGEFHPWNPMKALKDEEVGDYYYKRKNYRAALDRYQEALYYKDNDAVASFRVAQCHEKLGNKDDAKKYYEQYLKILPEGPFAKDAHTALDRLGKPVVSNQ
jgi:tetratricopeptide (TPR) repeat protein